MHVPPKANPLPKPPVMAARMGVQVPVKTAFSALLIGKPQVTLPEKKAPGGSFDVAARVQKEVPREPRPRREEDDLDPMARRTAQLAPPAFAPPAAAPTTSPEPTTVVAKAHVSLEDLVPALVRRIAWAGDGRRGSVRIELGAGELAGGVLVVHAEGGKLRVELSVPSGVDPGAWRERLEKRLVARGLDVGSVEVS